LTAFFLCLSEKNGKWKMENGKLKIIP
jgi:hypothetical protein